MPYSQLARYVVYYYLMIPRPSKSTLFPYTTLFRSSSACGGRNRSASTPLWIRNSFSGGAPSRRSSASTSSLRQTKRSEEHTSELQSRFDLVCRLLLEKKKYNSIVNIKPSSSPGLLI